MNLTYPKAVSVLIAVIVSAAAIAQRPIVFLAPNVSVSYDTAKVRVKEKGITTPGQTGYVVFRFKPEKIEVRMSADVPPTGIAPDNDKPANTAQLREYLQKQIAATKKSNEADKKIIAESDQTVKQVGEFLGYGWAELNKENNSRFTTIFGYHISGNDFTRFSVRSSEQTTLNEHYKALEQLFKGFKTYSTTDIVKHDSLHMNKYTIVVVPAKDTLAKFKDRKNAYLAMVKTKEKFTDQLKQVYIHDNPYSEIFEPTAKGELYIAAVAKNKGLVEKEGIFVFVSSIGKEYAIPFRFKFEQK